MPQGGRLDTAEFLDAGKMVALFKQVATLSYDSDMSIMSVITSTSNWHIFLVHDQGCCRAQQLYSYSLSPRFFLHLLCQCVLDRLPHIFGVVGFVQSLLMSLLCLLDVSIQALR